MFEKTPLHRGFSLMEILVVVTIIGILVSVIMPAVNQARDEALVAATLVELDSIKTAMAQLFNDTGYYPNGEADYCRSTPPTGNEVDLSLASANLISNGGSLGGWSGPYLSGATDKWGTPYYLDEDYECMASTEGCKGIDDGGANSSVIVSCGPNRVVTGGSCEYDTDNIVYRLCD
jgi:prepilin-type N-terminal cleavage/methylation domain-containing protein